MSADVGVSRAEVLVHKKQSHSVIRSLLIAILAMTSAVALAAMSAFMSAVAWGAIALIVPGTGTQDPSVPANYEANALQYYINPNFVNPPKPSPCGAGCTPEPVPYISQFWPFPFAGWGGLQGAKWNVSVASGVGELNREYGTYHDGSQPIVIFGYSQGATVASTVKSQLSQASTGGLIDPDTTFVFIGNPNRPNGGLFERPAILGTVPILDATFGNPTPTNTAAPNVINTTDIAFQYDGVADFPAYGINALADLNAIAGFEYVHGTYLSPKGDDPATATPFGYTPAQLEAAMNDPANQQVHGDTLYITIPAKSLPIMVPFIQLGTATGTSALVNPVVALLQPATQTLIETGYDRTDYGTPTPFRIIPRVNPIKLATDLIADVPEGINAAAATIASPTHTIPDLPPTWGPAATTQTTVTNSTLASSRTSAGANVPAADKPSRPRILGPTGSDVQPVRDLVATINKVVAKPTGSAGSGSGSASAAANRPLAGLASHLKSLTHPADSSAAAG